MLDQTTAQYQVGQDLTAQPVASPSVEGYNLFIPGAEPLELGKIFHFEVLQPKKKLKGLFKGLVIDDEEIKESKESLFPEGAF